MNTKGKKPDEREYTLKVIPHQGETVRSYSFSVRRLKFLACALAALGVVLLAGFGYVSYSLWSSASDAKAETPTETGRQAELKELAKEAQNLQSEMEKLTEREKTLRRLLDEGAADESAKHTGQGGPAVPAEVSQVRRALDAVSRGLPERRENLAELEARYEKQREEAAARAAEKDKMGCNSFILTENPYVIFRNMLPMYSNTGKIRQMKKYAEDRHRKRMSRPSTARA